MRVSNFAPDAAPCVICGTVKGSLDAYGQYKRVKGMCSTCYHRERGRKQRGGVVWNVTAKCDLCGVISPLFHSRSFGMSMLKNLGWVKGNKPRELYCPKCAVTYLKAREETDSRRL